MPRVDSFSRFSEPPAPPPQQPLPEKPHAPSRTGADGFSPLKRSDTDKAKPPTSTSSSTGSPVARDSSQILSLLEALSSAKREIDTQGARMKELEDLLRQEKAAREFAEEKIKQLEMRNLPQNEEHSAVVVTEVPKENELSTPYEQGKIEKADGYLGGLALPSEASVDSVASQLESSAEVQVSHLQERLEMRMVEMEDMKKQVASYRDRAETAESETVQSRKSLAELIEDLRRERADKATILAANHQLESGNVDQGSAKSHSDHDQHAQRSVLEPNQKDSLSVQQSEHVPSKIKEVDTAATAFASQWQRRRFLEEASPYASMFGVVLLGVGLMAYLNGWQKMDK